MGAQLIQRISQCNLELIRYYDLCLQTSWHIIQPWEKNRCAVHNTHVHTQFNIDSDFHSWNQRGRDMLFEQIFLCSKGHGHNSPDDNSSPHRETSSNCRLGHTCLDSCHLDKVGTFQNSWPSSTRVLNTSVREDSPLMYCLWVAFEAARWPSRMGGYWGTSGLWLPCPPVQMQHVQLVALQIWWGVPQ